MTPFFSKGKTVFREWELKYTENTTFSITSTYRKLKYNFQMNKAFNINPLRESQNLNTVYYIHAYFCKTFGNCNSTCMNSKQIIFVIYMKKEFENISVKACWSDIKGPLFVLVNILTITRQLFTELQLINFIISWNHFRYNTLVNNNKSLLIDFVMQL